MKSLRTLFAFLLFISPSLARAADIHDAAAADNTNAIASLLRADAALVNARTADGLTPLHVAAASNATKAVAALVKAGAEVDACTPDRKTPLQLAITADSADAALWLVENTMTVYTIGLTGPPDLLGHTLLTAEEAQRAHTVLMSRFRGNPANEKLNFALGLLDVALNEPGKAELAFERVLQLNPRNDRARFELARVAMSAGRLSVAKEEFEKVLARKPQPLVEQRIRSYLTDINRQMSRWRWAARADAGWLWDDNANIGPNAADISIAPLTTPWGAQITSLSRGESAPAKASGPFASVAARGLYDLGDTAGWMLLTDGSYYRNWLGDDWRYESQFCQGGAGLRYAGKNDMGQAALSVSRIDSGRRLQADMYGLNPAYLHTSTLDPNLTWLTSAQAEWRDYDARYNAYDGAFVSAGETARYGFNRGRHCLSATVAASHDFADASAYEYTGLMGAIGGELGLWSRAKLYAQCRYTTKDYRGREPMAPADRTDKQFQTVVGLTATVWGKWGVDVNHQYTDNQSTFDLHEYTRNLTTIGTWVEY